MILFNFSLSHNLFVCLFFVNRQITSRINKLCYGLDPNHVDAAFISQKVVQGVYPGVTTVELDELAAQTAASCATKHPDFSTLAARISVSNLHKQTSKVFSDVVEILFHHVHPKTHQASPLVSEDLHRIVMEVTHTHLSPLSLLLSLSLFLSLRACSHSLIFLLSFSLSSFSGIFSSSSSSSCFSARALTLLFFLLSFSSSCFSFLLLLRLV